MRLASLLAAVLVAAPLPALAQTAPYRVAPSKTPVRPDKMMPVGSRLGFSAQPTGGQLGLWISDGTDAGTTLLSATVLDVSGSSGADNTDWGRIGEVTVFVGNSAAEGFELWRTDGTPAGTQMIKALVPGYDWQRDLYRTPTFGNGSGYLWTHQQVPAGGVLYFIGAALDSGRELWKTDGTAAGTVLVKEFAPGTADGMTMQTWPAFGRVAPQSGSARAVFVGPDGGLWTTDGTGGGTVRIGTYVVNTAYTTLEFKGKVYLAGKTSASATTVGLVETDGTAAGTRMLSEGAFSFPGSLTASGDRFYFFANDVAGTQTELWTSDGTSVARLAVLHSGIAVAGQIAAAPGGGAFVTESTGTSNYGLWKSDGTAAGTAKVVQLPGTPQGLTVAGSRAYFNYMTSFGTPGHLWTSDGTAAGTGKLAGINDTGTGFAHTPTLLLVGSTLYLSTLTSYFDKDLWAIGGLTNVATEDASAPGAGVALRAIGARAVALDAPGGLVRVEAFDLLGRRVALLHDGEAMGTLRLALPPGLGAGAFLVRATLPSGASSSALVRAR